MRQGDPDARRLKLVCLDSQAVLGMFWAPRFVGEGNEVVHVASWYFPDMPDDVRVMGVYYSYSRQAWEVCLSHPSWPEIPQGEMIPTVDPVYQGVCLRDTPCVRYETPNMPRSWRDEKPQL